MDDKDKDDNYNDISNEDEPDNDDEESIKVVLLGESGVGKTSIISQFTKGVFNQDCMSTNGATFSTKKKEFKELKKILSFEIWDTAGQEKYRALAKMFFKDAAVALLVYDISSKKTFIEIRDYWLDIVKENCSEKLIIYLVGNKYDLIEKEDISEEEVREYAKSVNVPLWFTSAKDSTGIEDLFDEIGQKYLDPEFSSNEEIKERRLRKNDTSRIIKDSSIDDNNKKRRGCCG